MAKGSKATSEAASEAADTGGAGGSRATAWPSSYSLWLASQGARMSEAGSVTGSAVESAALESEAAPGSDGAGSEVGV